MESNLESNPESLANLSMSQNHFLGQYKEIIEALLLLLSLLIMYSVIYSEPTRFPGTINVLFTSHFFLPTFSVYIGTALDIHV